MVREAGVEPARPCEHWHLKPASLPIPPLARMGKLSAYLAQCRHYITISQGRCQAFFCGILSLSVLPIRPGENTHKGGVELAHCKGRSVSGMKKDTWRSAVSGAAAGAANGLFGGGGGSVLVPLLTRFCGLEQRQAFSTSLAVILPLCVLSAAVYLFQGGLDLTAALPYLIGGTVGGWLGGHSDGRGAAAPVLRRLSDGHRGDGAVWQGPGALRINTDCGPPELGGPQSVFGSCSANAAHDSAQDQHQ